METYTYKCQGCGAQLEFDAKAGVLICNNCMQFYSPESLGLTIELPKVEAGAPASEADSILRNVTEKTKTVEVDEEFMDINLFHCSSCGSRIMTNDVEIAKKCSYCGQPTIIFERVSRERRPKKIIPFRLTKEEAIRKAKERFAKGKYIVEEAENIDIESVYGIYMPYYAYDAYMMINAQATLQQGNESEKTYYPYAGTTHTVLLDLSERFNDDVSKQLNPFPVATDMENFHPSYLSGFYADCNDVMAEAREEDAKAYIREILIDQALDQLPIARKEVRDKNQLYNGYRQSIVILKEKYELNQKFYILCPVYFVTFSVKGKHTILLVNGATGKVVGGIPVDEKMLKRQQRKDMFLGGLIGAAAGCFLVGVLQQPWAVLLVGVCAYASYKTGIISKEKYDEMYSKMNSDNMFDLSRNRE